MVSPKAVAEVTIAQMNVMNIDEKQIVLNLVLRRAFVMVSRNNAILIPR